MAKNNKAERSLHNRRAPPAWRLPSSITGFSRFIAWTSCGGIASCATAANEAEGVEDSDFLKEFVISPDDLITEAVQEHGTSRRHQQTSSCHVARHSQHPCSPVRIRGPSSSNSNDSRPPLSPSVDGSHTSASPESSCTFAGWEAPAGDTVQQLSTSDPLRHPAEDIRDDAQSLSVKASEQDISHRQATLSDLQKAADCCRPSTLANPLSNRQHSTAEATSSADFHLDRYPSLDNLQQTSMLMLQLDAVQDSEQNHPEPTSESPYPPNVVTSPTTLQPVHQQLPVAAQLSNSAVSGLSPTAKSVLAAPTGNAPLKVHADDALLPTAPPELISNEMWHNSNSGPNSTPASMFHERQGKDAQTSVTSVNVAHHPLSLPCHTLNPTPQSSMPVSLQHVHPQQLSQVQLQNLHKAAKLLSLPVPAKAEAVQTPQAVLQPKRAAAPAIARCKLAAAAPPAHCRNHELAADANRHAEAPACLVHDTSAPSATTYPCMATHSPGSHTHSKHQLPPLHCSGGGDPSDAIAASLDGKLDRMAPAVSLLFVDTLRVGQRSTHVEPSAQRAVNDSQKRSFSAMQVEASAALPLAEAPTSQPDKADNEPPAPVQQDDVCLAKHRAQIGQGPDLVRTGKDVQRKRFRKPTGLEVLYRTRPLVCAQLYASGIQLQ